MTTLFHREMCCHLFLFSGDPSKAIGLAVGLTLLFIAILAVAGVIVFLHIRSEY